MMTQSMITRGGSMRIDDGYRTMTHWCLIHIHTCLSWIWALIGSLSASGASMAKVLKACSSQIGGKWWESQSIPDHHHHHHHHPTSMRTCCIAHDGSGHYVKLVALKLMMMQSMQQEDCLTYLQYCKWHQLLNQNWRWVSLQLLLIWALQFLK